MNGSLSGFTVTYSNITGLITIANSNLFLLNFATSTMYVVLGFLPQLSTNTFSLFLLCLIIGIYTRAQFLKSSAPTFPCLVTWAQEHGKKKQAQVQKAMKEALSPSCQLFSKAEPSETVWAKQNFQQLFNGIESHLPFCGVVWGWPRGWAQKGGRRREGIVRSRKPSETNYHNNDAMQQQ